MQCTPHLAPPSSTCQHKTWKKKSVPSSPYLAAESVTFSTFLQEWKRHSSSQSDTRCYRKTVEQQKLDSRSEVSDKSFQTEDVGNARDTLRSTSLLHDITLPDSRQGRSPPTACPHSHTLRERGRRTGDRMESSTSDHLRSTDISSDLYVTDTCASNIYVKPSAAGLPPVWPIISGYCIEWQ